MGISTDEVQKMNIYIRVYDSADRIWRPEIVSFKYLYLSNNIKYHCHTHKRL